jgi:response regulator of citrate/malate metabolism
MGRDRDDQGKYSEQVTLNQVLATFDTADVPVLTATNVADELACARPTAYNKLETLVERGSIEKKKVGSRAVVYIKL